MPVFLTQLFTGRIGQLLRMVKDHRARLFFALMAMVVVAASQAAIPFVLKHVMDDIFVNKDSQMLNLIPVGVIVLYLVRGAAMYYQAYLMKYVGEKIVMRLRNRLYNRIQDLPLSFFHKEQTGALMSRITHDVSIVREMISDAMTGIVKDAVMILGLAIYIYVQDWKLAMAATVILPIAFYPISQFGRRIRRYSTGYQAAMADMSAFLFETFTGNKIVKAFGMEAYEKNRFKTKSTDLFRLQIKQVVVRALSSPVMECLGGFGIAFIIWFGGRQVIAGTQTVGTFTSFIAAVLLLYDPVRRLSKFNNTIQQGMAAADRVFDIIEHPSEIKEVDHPVVVPDGPHRICFKNVSFGYSDGETVLKGIDLDVHPGEIVALVGASGGGKTTLVNLIPRFFDTTEGVIEIDGQDIRGVSLASLRRQIAIVTQEPILFNDSVRHNIAYGRQKASAGQIVDSARAAYVDGFVSRFPNGYDTRIGELGDRLSGGEKQRLCIARALLKDAPILILDEATSSLDSESEQLVQKALENLMRGRTTFVIAHRLSTVRYADRIVVIDGGRIVETGTHQELLKQQGAYFNLCRIQSAKDITIGEITGGEITGGDTIACDRGTEIPA
ncbi:MAG: ABC transporter permease [Deltaproteobacteria bacterium]|nr:MAG: ABC transporter permease [Deltaproteobacteria bacterium]